MLNTTAPVTVYDNLLPSDDHSAVWTFLNRGGWSFGGYSDADGDRYFYKHFAGFEQSGDEPLSPSQILGELAGRAPILAQLWGALNQGPLAGHSLARCYANAMPSGAEGSLHLDSNAPDHLTAIYYPHPSWTPNLGGETLIFNPAGDDILAAIYPRPNRLAVFAGNLPHVARPASKRHRELRITLMFKIMPALVR